MTGVCIADCLNVLSAYPINFLFTVRTVEDLRREVQRKVEEHEMDMLIVDYFTAHGIVSAFS